MPTTYRTQCGNLTRTEEDNTTWQREWEDEVARHARHCSECFPMPGVKRPRIGTISFGTLLCSDLIAEFVFELNCLGGYRQLVNRAQAFRNERLDDAEWDYFYSFDEDTSEEAHDILDQLQDALSECAMPFMYFGTLEGDGSDFGFWPDHDGLEYAMRFGDCDDDGNYILDDDGVRINVSDHGNVAVYDLATDQELWSCV